MRNNILRLTVVVAGAVLMLGGSTAWANWPPSVYNIQALQRGGANLVDVYYTLADPEGDAVTISVYLSTDGGLTYPVHCVTVSGDVGSGITPGSGRHIVWDAGSDFPGYNGNDCRIRVVADDGGGSLAGFVHIPGGQFLMGSPTTEPSRGSDEVQHWVYVSPFYISELAVTKAQYAALNPGYVVDFPNRPAVSISWYEAIAFCNELSTREGYSPAYDGSNVLIPGADGYRLPTEAEWEFACRAGTPGPFNTGSCLDSGSEANFNGASNIYPGCSTGTYLGHTSDVGSYAANGWGLFDMHGNVWEWCTDGYSAYGSSTPENPLLDPVGSGSDRVIRGGGYYNNAAYCRSAQRHYRDPSYTYYAFGFRLVRSAN